MIPWWQLPHLRTTEWSERMRLGNGSREHRRGTTLRGWPSTRPCQCIRQSWPTPRCDCWTRMWSWWIGKRLGCLMSHCHRCCRAKAGSSWSSRCWSWGSKCCDRCWACLSQNRSYHHCRSIPARASWFHSSEGSPQGCHWSNERGSWHKHQACRNAAMRSAELQQVQLLVRLCMLLLQTGIESTGARSVFQLWRALPLLKLLVHIGHMQSRLEKSLLLLRSFSCWLEVLFWKQ